MRNSIIAGFLALLLYFSAVRESLALVGVLSDFGVKNSTEGFTVLTRFIWSL